ncbi:MAG: hypothetical protein RR291_00270 [Clostridia bacterium]
MKRGSLEKVAIVAHICITFVFVLLCILLTFGVITLTVAVDTISTGDRILQVFILALGVIYVALSIYLIYLNFSDQKTLRAIVLFTDSESTTKATRNVINHIVKSASKMVQGIKIRRIQINNDDKMGFKLKVTVEIVGELGEVVDQARCVLADSFFKTLGVRFSTIDFNIKKLSNSYTPDIEQAKKQAELLRAQRVMTDDIYRDPLAGDTKLSAEAQKTAEQEHQEGIEAERRATEEEVSRIDEEERKEEEKAKETAERWKAEEEAKKRAEEQYLKEQEDEKTRELEKKEDKTEQKIEDNVSDESTPRPKKAPTQNGTLEEVDESELNSEKPKQMYGAPTTPIEESVKVDIGDEETEQLTSTSSQQRKSSTKKKSNK